MAQQLVVIDVPPLEEATWAAQVFTKAGLKMVSNDAVSDAMGKDDAARDALMKTENAFLEAEKLAPHYRRVFEALHKNDPKLGLWGTAWLVYVPNITACIVDWDEVEKRAKTDKTGPERYSYDQFKKTSYEFVRARQKKFLAADKYLELPLGLTAQQKIDASLEFLRKRGVIS